MKTYSKFQIEAGFRRHTAPGLIILLLAVALGPGSAFAQGNSAPLLTTFTNPTPAASDLFGFSVAAVGRDRVLIGMNDYTRNGGTDSAYLFSLTGTLITTFTNPTGVTNFFGFAVAALGSDRVLITGGYSNTSVAVYLLSINGTLLTTLTNPVPAEGNSFGSALAAVGSDRVIIGAPGSISGLEDSGEAYLFSTNGALLTTFTNPAPAAFVNFGYSVAAMGSDRVLIGAWGDNTGGTAAGLAYLFSINGTLLTTFTNPSPADFELFGFQVAAVGSDRVLISANGDNSGATLDVGAAYLFTTNGTLVTTFTNPTPAGLDDFGWRVAAVGSSRVLICAERDDTGAQDAGTACLFSTNGTLLTTFTNPTPAVGDRFGVSVAVVGSDQVLIGAMWDDTGATDSGAAYLFDLPYPALSIARNGSAVSLKWTTPETGIALQQTDLLGTSTVWNDTTNSVSITGLTNVVQQTMTATNRFFRLHLP
ncbi:MAG: hypothetical protein HOP33_11795 [Verrucomicrobia bacterium]|nr:hypothetical protein [Verrucomicrobiota bacterium]